MKILFISPLLPWPLYSGGQVRAYHLIKALSQKHEVTVMAYIRSDSERKYLPEVEKICYQLKIFKRQHKAWSIKTLSKTLFSTRPLVMNLYDTTQKIIEDKDKFDLIYCECFYLMDKITKINLPIFLSEQNIEYLAYRRYLDNLPFWQKIFLWLPMKWDLCKMKFWEKKMWQQAAKVCAMSDNDKALIEKETGRKDIIVIPNGVDTSNFPFLEKINSQKTILFVGNFSWFQNQQAVKWLVKDIFPRIKKRILEAELLIVGRNAPEWLREIGKIGDIKIDERIEDIRKVYQQAAVFLAPLKSGSGTKYKILEAMAAGVPIVTTKVGVEGFDKSCLIVKEDTDGLAESVVDLLNNPEKYQEMIKRARKLVEENFDWEIIGQKINDFISKA